MTAPGPTILHVCSREIILDLRESILRLNGFKVISTLSIAEAEQLFERHAVDLVLIDVEGDGRIPEAEALCEFLKQKRHGQKVAFVCNYRVSLDSDCPDEIIRNDFNPEELLAGIRRML